jgi:hypothetical protein
LLDEDMTKLLTEGIIPDWCAEDNWRPDGIDNTVFPRGEIPMKRVLMKDGDEVHNISMKYFAMAHRRHGLTSSPRMLLRFTLKADDVLAAIWNGTATIHEPHMDSLCMKKPLGIANYPGMMDLVAHPITPELGESMLDGGRRQLNDHA